jgi:SAM-dependent methyltransferase
MEAATLKRVLVEDAAGRYRSADRFAYHFARGKLNGDPAFAAVLARGLIPDAARILDLGCGQGLLAAWLAAAVERFRAHEWHDDWPAPPTRWTYRGIELKPRDVARANAALGTLARVEVGDIRAAHFGQADAVVILDVLHYMDKAYQEAVLAKVRAALSRLGVLLLRIGDASAGLPFRLSNFVDHTVLLVRGHGWPRLQCRTVSEWLELLGGLGFRTEAVPMSAGTPFANVLLVARPR